MENQIIQNKKEETKEINSKQEIINIGDVVRLRTIKTAFTDKQQARWTSKLYKVIKVGINTLKVEDNEGKEYNVKKSDAKLIKEVQDNKQLKESLKANLEHKIEKNIKKSGVDVSNIIETKRIRKTIH
jgi:hypothetical protein